MNSGIIAILMKQYEYQFPGLHVLSTIAFLVDFVLFIIFSVVFLLRFAWFPKQAFHELTHDLTDLGLMACWPVAWLTNVAFVSLNVSQAYWGGHAFTIVAYVMWWIGAAWISGTLLFVFIMLINQAAVSDRELPPTVIIPAVAVSTLATVGGLLSSFSANISGRMAVPVIILSFCAVGVGLLMALFLYTLLLQRLFIKGWPPAAQITNMFLFVGPLGQCSAALQLLGSAANTYNRFGEYNKGTFLTHTAAMPLDVSCILISLLLTGMATIWLIIAFYAMFYRLFRKELVWAPTWNAIIFPTGTFTTSTLLLGIEMDSAFFKVVTGILIVFLVLVYFINLVFTVLKVFKGELLIVREDSRKSRSD